MLGTVCKVFDEKGKYIHNFGVVQKIVFKKQSVQQATDKIQSKVIHNLQSLEGLVTHISKLDQDLRLLRIGSDLLPLYSIPQSDPLYGTIKDIYNDSFEALIDTKLAEVRQIIDLHKIRVCTHPSQYTVVNSLSEEVRKKSYEELYYHLRFMSRLSTVENTSINVHLNGGLDHLPEIDQGLYQDLIPWLSFENEDKRGKLFCGNVLNTLAVCERYNVKFIYDHHHNRCLDTVELTPDLVDRIIKTWSKSVKPLAHISDGKTAFDDRKHSDQITTKDSLDFVVSMFNTFDIEVEAKDKNLAVAALLKKVRKQLCKDLN